MQPPLLAIGDDLPNYEAIALSPGVGWLMLAAVTCLAMFFIAHRDAWRKLWLRMDDPRPLAAVRILFGICTLCNINGLWEVFGYLFTDEGIFSTDLAQHYRARAQFAGFGDGTAETEPWGFFSFGAFVEWLKGPNYSLLLFDSSPTFFWTYLVFFEIAMVLFIIGFKTQWTKWIAWFLFMGIILRSTLYWEGTENVFRVFFFCVVVSRCGETWSVDNWLRCRRLRKEGRLSEPGGPGDGAGAIIKEESLTSDGSKTTTTKILEPIHRPIPGWPRVLIILNLAVLYCATGVLKNGPIWAQGDSFYYAFNLDHFYRLPPQQLTGYFGTTVLRLCTWVVHWWEALFPLLVFGLVVRWHLREKIPRLVGWRLWMARIGLGGFVAWFYGIILYSYPVHYHAPPGGLHLFGNVYGEAEAISLVQRLVGVGVPILAVLVVWGYRKLRKRQDLPLAERGRLPGLDLDWVCRWVFGRRVWVVLGLIFHIHLILNMNVGWFSPGLLACYPAFLNGDELEFIGKKLTRVLNKRLKLPMPKLAREGRTIPSADPALPHLSGGRSRPGWTARRDGYQQPWAIILTGLGLAVLGIVRRAQTDEDMWGPLGRLAYRAARVDLPAGLAHQDVVVDPNWFVLMIAVMALVVMARRMRGFVFNPWFSPVILLTAWLGSIFSARGSMSMGWAALAVGVLSFAACRVRAPTPKPVAPVDPETGRRTRPWAYGPIGRNVVSLVIIYHLCAVASTQFPEKDSWSTFRGDTAVAFKRWLETTQTTQGWGMFAPNPPRSNVFLRVTVTDTDGEVYDLNTDVYACFMPGATQEICDAVYPIPLIGYTRQRKINRRIAGSEGGLGAWYQKWHARWVCRQWELDYGHLPHKIDLYRVTYPMPSPEEARLQPYDPKTQYNAKGAYLKVHTTECKGAVSGQMTNEVRRRHGLPEVDEALIRTWTKRRCRNWESDLIETAREDGEEVDILDPRFDVCPDMTKEVRKALYEQNKEDLLLED